MRHVPGVLNSLARQAGNEDWNDPNINHTGGFLSAAQFLGSFNHIPYLSHQQVKELSVSVAPDHQGRGPNSPRLAPGPALIFLPIPAFRVQIGTPETHWFLEVVNANGGHRLVEINPANDVQKPKGCSFPAHRPSFEKYSFCDTKVGHVVTIFTT